MKKICLVCDIPNWAFDIISKKLKVGLANDFEIDIAYYDVRSEADTFFEFLEAHKECDIIHFFWRKALLQFESETFQKKVKETYGDVEEYIQKMSQKLSTEAYDFLFLQEDEIDIYKNVFNQYVKSYYVTSKMLLEEYLKIDAYKKPYGVVHDMFSNSELKPMNEARFKDHQRPLVVGWIGNSAVNFHGIDLKGFHSIIKPVVQELQEEGYNIIEHYADRNIKWRTSDEMPEYYSEIDVCMCTSITEGTPLPVLEAMACGVPIIATRVGVIPEAFGELQQEFIIGDREYGKNDEEIAKKLKEKLIKLYENRDLLEKLSEENPKSILQYDGGKILNEYREYFNQF